MAILAGDIKFFASKVMAYACVKAETAARGTSSVR